jgi:hypothetical protein
MTMARLRGRIEMYAFVMLALALAAMLAGCGVQSAAGSPVTCASPTSGASAAQSVVRTLSDARVVPVTTLPPAVTPGEVRVAVDGQRFGQCDTITLWAGNGLSQTIVTADHQTDCSIVTLQRQVSSAWQVVGTCNLATPTRVVELQTNTAQYIQLQPGAAGVQGASWQAGAYRVAFTYHTGESSSSEGATVYSSQFTIG